MELRIAGIGTPKPMPRELFLQAATGKRMRFTKRGSLKSDLPRKSALDFGCGIGRLSFNLASRFD